MPHWLILPVFIFGCTLVPPVIVWCGSTNWRHAWRAWWFFSRYLLVLAVPAAVIALGAWAAS